MFNTLLKPSPFFDCLNKTIKKQLLIKITHIKLKKTSFALKIYFKFVVGYSLFTANIVLG